MLTTYLQLIKEQRKANPTFPKDYRVDSLPRLITTSTAALDSLVAWPNARFTNIIERQVPLYRDVEDVYYYEFVDLGLTSRTTLPDWKYFYIPVSKYDELILVRPNILPTYKKYDVETATVETIPTINQPLIPYDRPDATFFNEPQSNQVHPLATHFIFTGYSFLDKKGSMIYEYVDDKLYHDDTTVTYYSSLRPFNFIFPSVLVDYSLESDGNEALLDLPPSSSEIYNNTLLNLVYTGFQTTKQFSSKKRWYEYYILIEGEVDSELLLPYPPTIKSIDFVEVELRGAQAGITFNPTFNTQSLGYNQVSSNNKLGIQ